MAKQIFKLAVECVKLLLIAAVLVFGTVGAVNFLNECDRDESETEPARPLSAERRAEIKELYAQIAADLQEINTND